MRMPRSIVECFLTEIDKDDFDLAAVIGVDGAGRVENRDAVFGGEAGAWADLRFVSGRQSDGDAGGDERALAGCELYLRVDGGGKIQPGGLFGSVRGKGEILRVRHNLQADIEIILLLLCIARTLAKCSPILAASFCATARLPCFSHSSVDDGCYQVYLILIAAKQVFGDVIRDNPVAVLGFELGFRVFKKVFGFSGEADDEAGAFFMVRNGAENVGVFTQVKRGCFAGLLFDFLRGRARGTNR
jgi:hypothetical protein